VYITHWNLHILANPGIVEDIASLACLLCVFLIIHGSQALVWHTKEELFTSYIIISHYSLFCTPCVLQSCVLPMLRCWAWISNSTVSQILMGSYPVSVWSCFPSYILIGKLAQITSREAPQIWNSGGKSVHLHSQWKMLIVCNCLK